MRFKRFVYCIRALNLCSMSRYNKLLLNANHDGINEAAKLLKEGKLLAFPTETVYGLGANALNEEAVKSIFEAKGRPLTDPLIVHVSDAAAAQTLIDVNDSDSTVFNRFGDTFWPGPLTLIVKASHLIPLTVTANTGFVGIRVPKHPIAQQLLQATKLPIAAPSANRFGHVSPTKAQHVLDDLGEKGVHVLNGEYNHDNSEITCEYGIESTVAKIDGPNKQIILFRQGAITQQQLETELQKNNLLDWKVVAVTKTIKMKHTNHHHEENTSTLVANTNNKGNAVEKVDNNNITNTKQQQQEEAERLLQESIQGQEAPGQAITHYAPDVPCYILKSLQLRGCSNNSNDIKTINNNSNSTSNINSNQNNDQIHTELLNMSLSSQELLQQTVIIDYGGVLASLRDKTLAYRDLSTSRDPSEAARNLFDVLRWSEQVLGAKRVLIVPILSALEIVGDQNNKNVCNERSKINHDHDITLGLADRIFRAASGTFVNISVI